MTKYYVFQDSVFHSDMWDSVLLMFIFINCLLSSGFLPSSFSMYAISLASGLFLLDKPAAAVAVAVIGVVLGWPFSILAFLPVTLYSLYRKFKQTFIAGAVTSVILLVSQIFFSHFDLPWPVNYACIIYCSIWYIDGLASYYVKFHILYNCCIF